MAEINLAPGTQYIVAARRRRRRLYVLAVLCVAIIGAAWGLLVYAQTTLDRQVQRVTADVKSVNTAIAQAGEFVDRIEAFEGRLTALTTLLDDHVSWAPLLQEIERLLPPEVVLTGLTASHDKSLVEIAGVTPSIDQLSQAFASLESEPDRATLFSRAAIARVDRQEIIDSSGVVTGVSFEFTAELEFNRAAAGN